ncbi:MAG: hypothetical protein K5675_00450, partial [Lachnospiraceae bacterium]|nr:hypothetical protein [Lachnospiraceae bacterium]
MKKLLQTGLASILALFTAFTFSLGSVNLTVFATTNYAYDVDSLSGYSITLSSHTLTYDENDGDGVLTAVIGTYADSTFTESTATITYTDNRISWSGDDGITHYLQISNNTGSTLIYRLPTAGTETTIENSTTVCLALDANGTHFEFAMSGSGSGSSGSNTANIKVTGDLTVDTTERADALDLAIRIGGETDVMSTTNIYQDRFDSITSNTYDYTIVNSNSFSYTTYVDDNSIEYARFWFGTTILTKITSITITVYSDSNYSTSSGTFTYTTKHGGNSSVDSPIFDYTVQSDVVNCFLDQYIWFPVDVTTLGDSYEIEVDLASTNPTRVEDFDTLSDADAISSLASSDIQLGNFGWSYNSTDSGNDDYVVGGYVDFVSLDYNGT